MTEDERKKNKVQIALSLLLLAYFVCASESAQAYGGSSGSSSGIFYGSYGVNAGYGSSVASSDPSTTSVGLTTLGAAGAFRIAHKFLLGVMLDYRFVTQFSTVDPLVGNRRGGYLNYGAPMIGLVLPSIFFRAAYFLTGQYDLLNQTFSGQTVSYSSPSGFRLEFGLNWTKKIKPLLFFEQVSFSKKLVGGASSATGIPLTLQHYGLGLTVVL